MLLGHKITTNKHILTIKYIQAVTSHTYTQARFNNNTAHSLYKIMVIATSVVHAMGVMEMETIVSRAGIVDTSLHPKPVWLRM